MEFCVYCNNMLKIVKNKHNSEKETIDLPITDFTDQLIKMYDSEEHHYYNNEYLHIINFEKSELSNIDIDHVKELYPGRLEEDIRKDMEDLYDVIVTESENITNESVKNQYVFVCDTCNKTFHLRPNTLLDTLNLDKSKVTIHDEPAIRFDDPTLFRTKNYICINDSCPTRTDTSEEMQIKKEAAFYKPEENNHSVRYICGVCYSYWRT